MPKKTGTKSQAIRDFVAKHPTYNDRAVVRALAKQNIDVSAMLVGNVRRPRKKKHEWVTIRVKRIDDPKVWTRRSQGLTTKLSIREYLAVLFEANEELPTSRKLTDEAILQAVVTEFPNRPSTRSILNRSMTINELRRRYNVGTLTGSNKKPAVLSKRYTMDGQVANGRTGKPLE